MKSRSIQRQKFATRLQLPGTGLALALTSLLSACSGLPGQSATGANPPPPQGVMNVADAAIAGGDPQMALKVSQSILASDPKNLDALYHEGAAYYAIGRCMDAIAVYKVALGVDPKSSTAELGIGRCMLKRDAVQAEADFTAAVQDDPGNAAALNDLGIARDLEGNHAGAVQPYQQALLVDPGNTATEVNLGMSLALAGDGNDALQYLGPLATGQGATPKIREDYAAALVAAGREGDARGVLAVDLPPGQIDPLIADFQAAIAAAQPPVPATPAAPAAPPAAPTGVPMAAATPAAPAPVAQAPLAAPADPPPAASADMTPQAVAVPQAAAQPAATLPSPILDNVVR
jgi:Flp pilus assembly protein TadD